MLKKWLIGLSFATATALSASAQPRISGELDGIVRRATAGVSVTRSEPRGYNEALWPRLFGVEFTPATRGLALGQSYQDSEGVATDVLLLDPASATPALPAGRFVAARETAIEFVPEITEFTQRRFSRISAGAVVEGYGLRVATGRLSGATGASAFVVLLVATVNVSSMSEPAALDGYVQTPLIVGVRPTLAAALEWHTTLADTLARLPQSVLPGAEASGPDLSGVFYERDFDARFVTASIGLGNLGLVIDLLPFLWDLHRDARDRRVDEDRKKSNRDIAEDEANAIHRDCTAHCSGRYCCLSCCNRNLDHNLAGARMDPIRFPEPPSTPCTDVRCD